MALVEEIEGDARAQRARDRPPRRRRPGRDRAVAVAVRLAGTFVGALTTDRVVALTFDDGPDPDVTPGILDVLDRHGARATFFVLAGRAEAHPELVREVRERGHDVGLHGADHVFLPAASPREVLRVVAGGKRRLERVLGEPVLAFRPPYGAQSPFSFLVARALRMEVVGWTATGADWSDRPLADMVDHVFSSLRPGGVVLLHERIERRQPSATPAPAVDRVALVAAVMSELEARGWRVRTVDQLLRHRHPRRRLWFRSRRSVPSPNGRAPQAHGRAGDAR